MKNFKLNDLVIHEDKKGIFTVVGIREFEVELEDNTSCEWEPITKVYHYIQDGDVDLETWEYLKNKMENEGFHYCFRHYSRWEDIKDSKFHEMRIEYLKSAERLKEYIDDKIDKLS